MVDEQRLLRDLVEAIGAWLEGGKAVAFPGWLAAVKLLILPSDVLLKVKVPRTHIPHSPSARSS